MFEELERINERPAPFQYYTAGDLWTDAHTSRRMLAFHLDENVDVSSRNAAFIRRSVDWIAAEFPLGRDFTIADFGCGPGLYATALAKRGATVTGIDFSGRSIAYARAVAAREGLDIRYVQQNYLEFETEDRYDLVLMIMGDFCTLSPVQRRGLLGIFRTVLKPGASVLLDVYSLAAFARKKEEASYGRNLLDGFWSPDTYYGFLNTFTYPEEKVALDKYTIIGKERTRTVYNWFQYFSPADLEREFAAAGFAVQRLLADVAGRPFDPEAAEFAAIAVRV